MAIHPQTGANLNKLTGTELVALERLAQMLSTLNDRLVAESFSDSATVGRLLISATPFLAERSFNAS